MIYRTFKSFNSSTIDRNVRTSSFIQTDSLSYRLLQVHIGRTTPQSLKLRAIRQVHLKDNIGMRHKKSVRLTLVSTTGKTGKQVKHIFPRSIIHWNARPAHIPVLPTLAQFSNAVCQVIHVSPSTPVSVFTF